MVVSFCLSVVKCYNKFLSSFLMEKSLLRFLFNSFVIYGTFHIPSQNIRNQKKNVLKYDIEIQSEVIQGLRNVFRCHLGS